MSHYCEKCGKTMDDKEFYTSYNIERYPPDGKLNQCKKCMTMHVDNWDPETYKWILEAVDVPYIKEEWDSLLAKYGQDPKKITGMTIVGKYLSKMRMKQFNKYRWADSERIEQERLEQKVVQMRAQGLNGDEIEQQLSIDRTPPKPKGIPTPTEALPTLDTNEEFDDPAEDILGDQLTEEDKLYLRLKWGRGYRNDELVRMEQLYQDMMASYDIQGAGHKDTLIMICKASLKANQCIDAGDIEGFQKVSKVYDSLMKSGRFQAVQNKEAEEEGIDSIGAIVAMCEKDQFIPRYYVDSPNDKVDRVIQDMQKYTHDLVTEELGLEGLIQNSLKSLEAEKESIEAARANGTDLEEQQESELFDYDKNILEDIDFQEFAEFEESNGEEED